MGDRDYYEKNGYVVCRNLVSTDLVDKLVSLYKEQIVPSKENFFRQMTNKFEPNDVTDFGYVKQDFLDVHNYKNFPEFSTTVKEILCGDAIQNNLKQITGSKSLNLMQSLVFDVSRETLAHHDSYYLDTEPAGNAIAVWIALEDINEKAGRFYVVPNSTEIYSQIERPDMSHWEWMSTMHGYFEANLKDKLYAPDLHKGDVVFWNSRLIHGALPILDQSFSRKSLTSHFIPSEYKHQTPFMTKEFIECEPYNGVKIYTATVIQSTEWSSKEMTHAQGQ